MVEISKTLKPEGAVFIKENVVLDERTPIYDEQDHSVTRPEFQLLSLIRDSGFSVVSRKVQTDFPAELFPVVMYFLQPIKRHG